MEKRTVTFFSEGSRIEGELFLPDKLNEGEQLPGIVLCQGFTGVRSLILPDYAKVFVEAGFVVLTFDYRGWGRSEGAKWRLVPLEQVDDIRNALTFLEAQPQVDPERLGLWGTSYGGGHAPYVAGIDRRVKAVVGQVGYDAAERLFLSCLTYSERMDLNRKLAEDRRRRVLEGSGERVGPLEMLRDAQTRAFTEQAFKNAPPRRMADLSWDTIEKALDYRPIDVVDRIGPRPLLLIGASDDAPCPIEGFEKLYERAREPKKLVILPITHYEIYSGKWFEESSRLACQWFERYLK
jgi:uncharacterized protein